jgi:hypothetical protein
MLLFWKECSYFAQISTMHMRPRILFIDDKMYIGQNSGKIFAYVLKKNIKCSNVTLVLLMALAPYR